MSSKAKKTVDEETDKVVYRIYVGFSKKNLRTKENLKTTNKITKPFKINVLFCGMNDIQSKNIISWVDAHRTYAS